MSALLIDISDPTLTLPEFIVLDASVVLELVPDPSGLPHPHHTIAIAFLKKLQQATVAGEVIPLLPLLALEECYFKLCQRVLRNLAGSRGELWHNFYKKNPNSLHSVYPQLMTLYGLLRSFPIHVIEPEDIAVRPPARVTPLAGRMGDLINRYLLLPKDATILGEAERLGIFNVATLDGDWSRADGFSVYAPL